MSNSVKTPTLVLASVVLLSIREYARAADLADAARGNDSASLRPYVEAIRAMADTSQTPPAEDDPAYPAYRYALSLPGSNKVQAPISRYSEGNLTTIQLGNIGHELAALGLPRDLIYDMTSRSLRFEKEGDDSIGYRVRGTVSNGGLGSQIATVFTVRENGAYKLFERR